MPPISDGTVIPVDILLNSVTSHEVDNKLLMLLILEVTTIEIINNICHTVINPNLRIKHILYVTYNNKDIPSKIAEAIGGTAHSTGQPFDSYARTDSDVSQIITTNFKHMIK